MLCEGYNLQQASIKAIDVFEVLKAKFTPNKQTSSEPTWKAGRRSNINSSVTKISFGNVPKRLLRDIISILGIDTCFSLPRCKAAVGYLYQNFHIKNLNKTLINDFQNFTWFR